MRKLVVLAMTVLAIGTPAIPAHAEEDGRGLTERAVGGTGGLQPFRLHARGERIEPLQGLRPTDVVHPSSFELTATFDPLGQRERLSWQRRYSADTVAPGQVLSYDEILTANAGYVDGADVTSGQSHRRRGHR